MGGVKLLWFYYSEMRAAKVLSPVASRHSQGVMFETDSIWARRESRTAPPGKESPLRIKIGPVPRVIRQ